MQERPRRWGFRAAAIVLGVAVTLGFAEGITRLLGPPAPPPVTVEKRAPPQSELEVVRMMADAVGVKDRSILEDYHRPSDALRIAFLGDSFTFGPGVEPEAAFPRQVGLRLNNRRPDRTVTLNLGQCGADVLVEWLILNRFVDSVRPHVVVHVLSANDMDVDLYKDFLPILHLATERVWLSRYLRLCEKVDAAVRTAMIPSRSFDYMRGGSTPQLRDRSWQIVSHELQAIRHLTEENGGTYVLVRFPSLSWLARNPIQEVHARTSTFTRSLNIPYLDLWDVFHNQDSRRMCLTPLDDHPSLEAHRMAAEAIADLLCKEVLPNVRRDKADAPMPPRSPEAVHADRVRHLRQILDMDPTCHSAELLLKGALASQAAH